MNSPKILSRGLVFGICLMLTFNTVFSLTHKTQAQNINGNWHNCDGSIDNDPVHHSPDQLDLDPAHHMGQVCDGTKEAWKPGIAPSTSTTSISQTTTNLPTTSTTTTESIRYSTVTTELIQQQQTSITIPTVTNSGSGNPFAGMKLYINNYNAPSEYVRSHEGTYEATLMNKIASQPEVIWLGGWNTNISADVSNFVRSHENQGAYPVFVVYNLPNRDCGGYSAGGVQNSDNYKNWIDQISSSLGNRKAAIILEPDGLSLIDCLSSDALSSRYAMLNYAVTKFASQGQAVYLDAGHPGWISASEMANRLNKAGINNARGFALNIANFFTNSDNANYGKQISDLTGHKHFVVDTGRNGSGPTWDNQWCNPWGRTLGTRPTSNTGNELIDAYLWVKGPGGSDGYCNGGPSAGTFWPEYALDIARRSN